MEEPNGTTSTAAACYLDDLLLDEVDLALEHEIVRFLLLLGLLVAGAEGHVRHADLLVLPLVLLGGP